MLEVIHADQVRTHGGAAGVRDEGLLDSALARPRTRWGYEKRTDLSGLAASYGIALAKNHPFVDGNKRVAFQAMYVFLGLNGCRIVALESEVVSMMLGVAAGTTDEGALAIWIAEHAVST
ncbi:MAG: type II toxin-antitoxin system death-on-curing family toxin [Gemmatimonadota bacterium]|nr:type II toxin-antitoxin system death-on-curing family toxin [Gemmatimonadota bacterium]